MGSIAKRAAGTVQQGQQMTLGELIKGQMHKIMAVAPKHLSEDRLYQLTMSAINQTPKLAQCDLPSILSCVMKCSALGMEPSAVDGLGRAYILPFKNKGQMTAQFVLGYKGMIDLARRSGQIKDISSRAVYAGDEFEWEFGLEEKLRHRPSGAVEHVPANLTHVYMVAHFIDGGHYCEVMTKAEVDAVRRRSKAADNGPWVTDYEAMAKKTVIRRAFPYLPVSIELQGAAAADGTDGGYASMLRDEPIEVEAAVVEPVGESGPRKAVCGSCGNVVELAEDAEASDVQFLCCDNPNYQEVA